MDTETSEDTFLPLQVEGLDAEILIGIEDTGNELKYQVVVQENNDRTCSGGIISDMHIITATPCIRNQDGKVNTGKIKVLINNSKNGIEVEKYFISKSEYQNENQDKHSESSMMDSNFHDGYGDVVILKLTEKLGLDENLNLAKLELPNEAHVTYVDESPVVADYEKGNWILSSTEIVNNSHCNTLLPSRIVNSENLCAKLTEINRDELDSNCTDNSGILQGSPLVLDGNVVIGILVDASPGCEDSNVPAVYSRISSHILFIKNILKDYYTS